jgi:DNA-binding FrmR family transcriptional regulator
MRNNTIVQRLNIIRGQVDGLSKLVEKKADCQKITEQFYATNVALKKVIELYFKENLTSCLKSLGRKDKEKVDFLLKEIIKNK